MGKNVRWLVMHGQECSVVANAWARRSWRHGWHCQQLAACFCVVIITLVIDVGIVIIVTLLSSLNTIMIIIFITIFMAEVINCRFVIVYNTWYKLWYSKMFFRNSIIIRMYIFFRDAPYEYMYVYNTFTHCVICNIWMYMCTCLFMCVCVHMSVCVCLCVCTMCVCMYMCGCMCVLLHCVVLDWQGSHQQGY